MKIPFKKTLHFSLFALLSTQAVAHSVWLDDRLNEPTVILGHGASDEGYNPEKVTFVKGYDKNGMVKVIDKQPSEKNVSLDIPDNITYVGFVFDNGYWAKNKDGKWENKPKTEVDGATQGGRYIKTSIAVLNKMAVVKPVGGLDLQIIPLENPLTKKAGDTLDFQVLFKGKPLEGVEVTGDYNNMEHETVKTDKEGKVTLNIRNQGYNLIGVEYTEKLEGNPKADANAYASTLSFELHHLHEH